MEKMQGSQPNGIQSWKERTCRREVETIVGVCLGDGKCCTQLLRAKGMLPVLNYSKEYTTLYRYHKYCVWKKGGERLLPAVPVQYLYRTLLQLILQYPYQVQVLAFYRTVVRTGRYGV
jgi:hypothetical protein